MPEDAQPSSAVPAAAAVKVRSSSPYRRRRGSPQRANETLVGDGAGRAHRPRHRWGCGHVGYRQGKKRERGAAHLVGGAARAGAVGCEDGAGSQRRSPTSLGSWALVLRAGDEAGAWCRPPGPQSGHER